ncbi:MAG TPA: hypothetical protein VJA47_02585 [archaeon]|nr:hypothetical protein [archaeon]
MPTHVADLEREVESLRHKLEHFDELSAKKKSEEVRKAEAQLRERADQEEQKRKEEVLLRERERLKQQLEAKQDPVGFLERQVEPLVDVYVERTINPRALKREMRSKITVLERERQRLLSESHVCFIEVEEDEYWLMYLTRRVKSTISAMFRLKDADHFYKPGSEPGATYHMVSMMAGGHGGGVPSPRLSIDFPGRGRVEVPIYDDDNKPLLRACERVYEIDKEIEKAGNFLTNPHEYSAAHDMFWRLLNETDQRDIETYRRSKRAELIKKYKLQLTS